MKRAFMTLLFGFATLASPADARQVHVRVVLDLSQSMKTHDPGRMAILSTLLLHDLAALNTTRGDTFEVIPFDLDWKWSDPAAAPPVSRQQRIVAQTGRRQHFLQAVQALPYEARMTYFYPGIAAGIDDLEQKNGGVHDIRAIVLVTDGVPEAATRDAELQRIRDELAPRLEQHGIRLYVLAFGKEAMKHQDFFTRMLISPRGTPLGASLVDPNGTQLLTQMLEIFSRSFGFSPDTAHRIPGTADLDLEAQITPERVAVAVLAPQAQKPPSLVLSPPPGGTVQNPDGIWNAAVQGGSYSLTWVLQPNAGAYGFASDAAAGTVAVLRPARLAVEVLPAPPLQQTDRALAGMPFPLRIRIRPASGAQGDPGPVDLSFRTCGERVLDSSGNAAYAWKSDRIATASAGMPTPQGRVFDVVTEFPEDLEKPGMMYAGYLEVEVRRGEAVVGALEGMRAHRVEVHPPVYLTPLPSTASVSTTALGRQDHSCTHFVFQLDGGRLPHPERPQYPVRAVLTASNPGVLERELRQASFTLDGLPLEVEGSSATQPSAWFKGRQLTPKDLLAQHKLCVQMGKPTEGNPARPAGLKLVTTLMDDPYDEFGVVKPFHLKIPVAPPSLYERWRFVLIPSLLAFAFLAQLWYLRNRPEIPRDLHYSIAAEESSADLGARTWHEPSAANLFGWVAERSVVAPGENRLLGSVRPVDKDLFQFRPASGVRVEALRDAESTPLRRGLVTLAVRRVYRLITDRGSFLFRMEYR
jgi:hypothetical protein